MNNKKNIYYILLLTAALGVSSCSKYFLDIPSQSSTDVTKAITDMQGMRAAINGVYNELQGNEYYGRTFSLLPDLMADNVFISSKNSGRYLHYDNYSVIKTDGYASDLWDKVYRLIVNCNLIIEKGSGLNIADDDKEEQEAIIGEAYALRALGHFDLCRAFAQPYNFTGDASHPGIPIVTKSSTSLDNIVKPSRNTVKEVYDTVISDLQKAITLLPKKIPGQSSSFKGMITLNAAKALLSRVYLYEGDWKDCEDLATDVIDSKQYKLLSTNSLVSDFSTGNSSETIFEIVNTETDNEGSNSLGSFYGQDKSYGDALGTQNLYDIYSDDDVRRDFMKIGNRNASGAEKNIPLVLKYGNTATYAENIKVIRLAEVYLNRAEARAHLNENAGAIEDLSLIAERANPNVELDPILAGQPLIDRILLERRKEFAFEGQRLFDLTRNKKDFVKYEMEGETLNVVYPNDKTILPIPQSEIDANTNLDQNPGYQ